MCTAPSQRLRAPALDCEAVQGRSPCGDRSMLDNALHNNALKSLLESSMMVVLVRAAGSLHVGRTNVPPHLVPLPRPHLPVPLTGAASPESPPAAKFHPKVAPFVWDESSRRAQQRARPTFCKMSVT